MLCLNHEACDYLAFEETNNLWPNNCVFYILSSTVWGFQFLHLVVNTLFGQSLLILAFLVSLSCCLAGFFFFFSKNSWLAFCFFQMFGLFFHVLYLIKYPLLSSAYFMNFGYFCVVFFFFLTSRTKMYIEESSIFTCWIMWLLRFAFSAGRMCPELFQFLLCTV